MVPGQQKVTPALLNLAQRLGLVKALIENAQLSLSDLVARLAGQTLIGAFGGQHLQRVQLAGPIIIAQQHFETRRPTPAAAGGEEFGQGVRTGAVRAVEEPNGTETLLEQLRHGRVGFPRQVGR